MEMKTEVNQEEAISFKNVGSSYVVSAPVSLGNYSVKFFHPFDVSVYVKSFF